jgi:hypothetical protein
VTLPPWRRVLGSEPPLPPFCARRNPRSIFLDRLAAALWRRFLLVGAVLAAGGFVAFGDGGLADLVGGWMVLCQILLKM